MPPKKKAKTKAGATASGGQYVRLEDGTNFYEMKLEGQKLTTRYGKIGNKGRTSVAQCKSVEGAQRVFDTQQRTKERKGYDVTSTDWDDAPDDEEEKAPAPTKGKGTKRKKPAPKKKPAKKKKKPVYSDSDYGESESESDEGGAMDVDEEVKEDTSSSPFFEGVTGKPPKVKAFKYGSSDEPSFPKTDYKLVKNVVLQVTDLMRNNNKYYALELHSGGGKHRLFTHYGRTGDLEANPDAGQKECRYYPSLHVAKQAYNDLYHQKTNPKKGYTPVSLAASNIGSDKAKGQSAGNIDAATRQLMEGKSKGKGGKKVLKAKSACPTGVDGLVRYLYEEATGALTTQVNVKITAEGIETPLGVLTMGQIINGEKILDRIQAEIEGKQRPAQLQQLSGQFYTTIPHKIGRSKAAVQAAVIKDMTKYKEKKDLMQLMKDMLKVSESGANVLHGDDVDAKYEALGSEIEMLKPNSAEYKEVLKYLKQTATKQGGYGARITKGIQEQKRPDPKGDLPYTLVNLYKVNRKGEKQRYTGNKIGNEHLLYHGSRISNWVGLLSRGILMPSAVTALGVKRTDFGWLGAGIYFGDCWVTSQQYCAAGKRGTQFCLLANVGLGKWAEQLRRDGSITAPPSGCHSIHGNPDTPGTQFQDHEWAIYDDAQQHQAYLMEFRSGFSFY